MHKLTIFPLGAPGTLDRRGNSDCTRIDLNVGTAEQKKLLIDFAHRRNSNDPNDKAFDLAAALRSDLADARRDSFDVWVTSHLDEDHYAGASEYFHLLHDAKYQGGKRIKATEMWVPAAVIMEPALKDEAKIIQAEARYRFKKGEGIRVVSGPKRLQEWCRKNGVDWESRRKARLIINAGELMPGYDNKRVSGLEMFAHSPFAHIQNQSIKVDRNDDSLVLQATFFSTNGVHERDTRLLLTADVASDTLSEIVHLTKSNGNEERLGWDIYEVPHHCSYRSLNEDDKGKDKTVPTDEIKWLLEECRQPGGIIISSSEPIPSDDPEHGQPPHRQAANTYKGVVDDRTQFLVTMEHPTKVKPEPIVIEINVSGHNLKKSSGGGKVITAPIPPAGAC